MSVLFSSTFQKPLCVSVLALLGVYVARCAVRSHQWRTEQSLFTSALSVCPLNAKVKFHTFVRLPASFLHVSVVFIAYMWKVKLMSVLMTDSSGAL